MERKWTPITRDNDSVNLSTKHPSRRSTIRKGERGRLLPSKFETFKWDNVEYLNIEDIKKEIPTRSIEKCNLKHLEFTGLTNFENIKRILRICTEIESLTFSDVVLYSYEPLEEFTIFTKLPNLRRLVFYGLGALSTHECHIIDFLHENVVLKVLKQVSLVSQRTDNWYTSSSNIFKPHVDGTALPRFLNKNWSLLKNLEINRTDVSLYDKNNKRSPKIVNIQLVNFACDMSSPGFKKVLDSQTELQVFKCYNKNLGPFGLDEVLSSFRRCSTTLREIVIQYNVIQKPGDFEDDWEPAVLNHDCRIYKYCKRLKKLNLSVSRMNEPQYPESFKIRPGAVINLQFIPTTLKNLIIRFDVIEDKEMKIFATIFSTFENLKHFALQGNPDMPYKLKLPWLLTLADLPKIEFFEFVYCKLEDLKVIEAIKNVLPSLGSKLKITENTCTFWKTRHLRIKITHKS